MKQASYMHLDDYFERQEEMQELWVKTNKEHGTICKACEHGDFEGDYFWGCRGGPGIKFPRDCSAVRRALAKVGKSRKDDQ